MLGKAIRDAQASFKAFGRMDGKVGTFFTKAESLLASFVASYQNYVAEELASLIAELDRKAIALERVSDYVGPSLT